MRQAEYPGQARVRVVGAIGWGWIAAVLAWTVAVVGGEPIAGFTPAEIATGLALVATALIVTGWAVERSRAGWRSTAGAVAAWVLLLGGLGAGYLHRGELLDAARSISEDLGIGLPEATIGQGGEVSVTRRLDGTFVVPAMIGDKDVPFIFDTGASAVVLSAETAAQAGIVVDNLRFRVPVSTANGRAFAAAITLDRMSVGSTQMRRVPALVVRPGVLEGNLLGQTFLQRLESYEVRGKRLVLRASKP